MFLGNVVNLFIGLALTFGTVALAVSSITEGIASALQQRAGTLLTGLKTILNDPDLTGLAGEVLTHSAVNPRLPFGKLAAELTRKDMPSYIPSKQFAAAMVDILAARGGGEDLLGGIEKLDSQLSPLFAGMLSRALERGATDLDGFRDSLAKWFDHSMERLSGEYKRWTLWVSLVIGFGLAIALNIDSCSLATALWGQTSLTMNVTQPPANNTDLKTILGNITAQQEAGFPFGWTPAKFQVSPLEWFLRIAGWALTATAALFGAPFWFDLLQRFVQLRGTGLVPAAIVPTQATANSQPVPAPTPAPASAAHLLIAEPAQPKRAQLAAAVQAARPPSIAGGIAWFKQNFAAEITAQLAGKPYSLNLLAAIAVQETYEIWGGLYQKLDVADLLALCVGDTLDAPSRGAFPKNKAALLAAPNGQALFTSARAALESIAPYNSAYRAVAANPDKFCHGFGIFQYDLQHAQTDANFFINKQWVDFAACLRRCIQELDSALARAYPAPPAQLTANQMVYTAIAYNQGSVNVNGSFKQGYRDSSGLYYGELIAKYLALAATTTP